MAWNGSGTYTRTNGTNAGSTTWQDDAAAGTRITASNHDTHDEDISTAINACLTKNNETKPTAHFLPNADASYNLGSASAQWLNLSLSGDATAATFLATGDTSAGDNAAVGYNSTDGVVLTGQGGTSDIVLKNDAAAAVLSIPTGTTNVAIAGDLTVTGDLIGTLTTAAQTNITSLGTLTALQVDNVNINGNTISSTAGTDLNITPLAGQQIVLDGAIVIDAGVVTGVTSFTVDNLNLNGNTLSATTGVITLTAAAGSAVSVEGVSFDGGVVTSVTSLDATGDITGGTFTADSSTSAGDLATLGYSSTFGGMLTGQGSTNDISLLNDLGQIALSVPTGTVQVKMNGGNLLVGDQTGATPTITIDATATGNPILDFHQAGTQKAFVQYEDTGDNLLIQAGSGSTLGLATNGTDALTIDTSQNIIATSDFTVGGGQISSTTLKIDCALANNAVLDFFESGARNGQIVMLGADGTLDFRTNGTTSALQIDSNQISTFVSYAIMPAATTSIPSIRLPHGTAPSSPTNGDMWTTTAGLYVRINGSTVGPLS